MVVEHLHSMPAAKGLISRTTEVNQKYIYIFKAKVKYVVELLKDLCDFSTDLVCGVCVSVCCG